jgi:hypothetical protein
LLRGPANVHSVSLSVALSPSTLLLLASITLDGPLMEASCRVYRELIQTRLLTPGKPMLTGFLAKQKPPIEFINRWLMLWQNHHGSIKCTLDACNRHKRVTVKMCMPRLQRYLIQFSTSA